jgi:hypothetical protein
MWRQKVICILQKTHFQSKRVSLSVKKLEQILKENEVAFARRNLHTALAQYKVTVKPFLTFGVQTININKKVRKFRWISN